MGMLWGLAVALILGATAAVSAPYSGIQSCNDQILAHSRERGADRGRTAYDAPARWQAVGLKVEVLQRWLTNAHCYESESLFNSCIAALNRFLLLQESPQLLVPSSIASQFQNPVYQDAGGHLVPVSRALDGREWMALRKAWDGAYASPARVDFTRLLAHLGKAAYGEAESWLVAEAINSKLMTVELHSSIEPAATYDSDMESEGETFRGLGTLASPIQEQMFIYGVLPGSPAEKAGIRPGDRLISLNGKSINAANYTEVVGALADQGDRPALLVLGRGGSRIELQIKTEVLVWPDVRSSIVSRDGQKLGLLKITGFTGPKVVEAVEAALDQFQTEGVAGIVLDLRDNGGGYMETGINIASSFLGENAKVLLQVPDSGEGAFIHVTDRKRRVFVPTVVLVGAQSKSMAEYLAGILQHFQAAWIVGTKTFGKGTVLSVQPTETLEHLKGYPLVYYKPTAQVVLPSITSPQWYGITPDIYVTHAPGEPEPSAMREADFRQARQSRFKPPEPPPRPEKADIEACLAAKGKAKQIFEGTAWTPIPRDYQMLVAADLLECLSAAK